MKGSYNIYCSKHSSSYINSQMVPQTLHTYSLAHKYNCILLGPSQSADSCQFRSPLLSIWSPFEFQFTKKNIAALHPHDLALNRCACMESTKFMWELKGGMIWELDRITSAKNRMGSGLWILDLGFNAHIYNLCRLSVRPQLGIGKVGEHNNKLGEATS